MNQKRPPSRFSLFLAELRRRHVWRAAIAYAAVAFVLLQTAEIVLPAFDAPHWALRLLIVLVLLGFPIALAAAWVYEMTPQGIRRERTEGFDTRVNLVARLVFLGLTLTTVAFVGWWVVRWTVPVQEVAQDLGVTEPGVVRPVAGEPGEINSLAVLPFESYSEEGQPDWFSAGMHEALVAQLSQIPALRVVSRTSVMKYEDTRKTAPEIARELRVDGIVEGSVLRVEDRVRITVQLIHGPTDRHIWTNSYERDLADAIELQAEVARAIAEEIKAEVSPEFETRLAATEPADPEALTEYMKARHEQSKGSPEALKTAVDHYQQALQEDSAYAPALAGLAAAQFLLGLQQPDSAADLISSAMSTAAQAVALDPNSQEARDVLAEVRSQMVELRDSIRVHVLARLPDTLIVTGVGERADSAPTLGLPQSVRVESGVVPRFEWVSPTSEMAYQIQLQRLEAMGDADRGIEVISPDRITLLALRVGLSGQSAEAEKVLRRLIRKDSTLTQAWDALEYLHAVGGDFEGAVEIRRERAERTGDPEAARRVDELERALRERGPRGYYEWHLARLEEREAAGEEVSHLRFAQVLLELGRPEEALRRLERAVEAREPGLPLLPVDPTWDPVRDRPSFQALVSSLRGLPPVPPAPSPGR